MIKRIYSFTHDDLVLYLLEYKKFMSGKVKELFTYEKSKGETTICIPPLWTTMVTQWTEEFITIKTRKNKENK